jgi:hypothetical protein
MKCRLTPLEHERLQQLANRLELRPGQVATRLVEGRLGDVPRRNHRLWVELGHTANNLTQLLGLLPDDSGPVADGGDGRDPLRTQAVAAVELVAALRFELLAGSGEVSP